jgi:predicted dithiol-disulfide oxidoreductase (DUF899 family)
MNNTYRAPVVTPAEWEAARLRLLVKEKELTRARDALAADGRRMPWLKVDFGVAEWCGTNAFIRDGDNVYRTYFINDREHEPMGGTLGSLDFTGLGRQEDWEDSPDGYPQAPRYSWLNRHDEYDPTEPSNHPSPQKSADHAHHD